MPRATGGLPYYDEVFALYERELEPDRPFVEVTIGLIEAFCSYLGIETERVRLSDTVESAHQKTDLIVDICRALGADAYLSGTGGGRDYNDEELLREPRDRASLRRVHPRRCYPQLWGNFEPGLSLLDLLFNCGPERPRPGHLDAAGPSHHGIGSATMPRRTVTPSERSSSVCSRSHPGASRPAAVTTRWAGAPSTFRAIAPPTARAAAGCPSHSARRP